MSSLFDSSGGSRAGWLVALGVVAAGLVLVALFSWSVTSGGDDVAEAGAPASEVSRVGVSTPAEDAIASAPYTEGAAEQRSISLPAPQRFDLFGQGFPGTPEGAAAALVAVADATSDGYDPANAQAIVNEVVLPNGDGLSGWDEAIADMRATRAKGGLPATGPTPGWSITWTPLMAKIRGVSAGGQFVQACVLGTSRAEYVSDPEKSGGGTAGTCQRMWLVDGQWRIEDRYSPQPELPAPLSDDAFRQGWRAIQ